SLPTSYPPSEVAMFEPKAAAWSLVVSEPTQLRNLRKHCGQRTTSDRRQTTDLRKTKAAGRTRCRSPACKNSGALLAFVDHFLEFVPGSEFGDSTSSDLDGGTRLRVSAIAGLTLRDGERAESDQGYPVTFSKGSGNAVHGGVDRGRRLRLCNTAGFGDAVNQISFVHALS